MLVLIGESASGKSTIEKILVEQYGFEKVISYTTRQPRDGEVNGVDYHFVSDAEFNKMNEFNSFVETAVYNGWQYGTTKKDVTENTAYKIAILTPHGLRQYKKQNVNLESFYINVPRRDRLIKILQRGDSIEEAMRRNISDVGQFDGIEDEVDYVITNPEYQNSAHYIANVINNIYRVEQNEK